MTIMQLTMAVNERRALRGKEPLRMAHIERVARFLFGRQPAPRYPSYHCSWKPSTRAPTRWDTPSDRKRSGVYRTFNHGWQLTEP